MNLGETRHGQALVLSAEGRLDYQSSRDFEVRMTQHLDGGERRIVLDLSGLEYASSAGMRVLLLAARRMKAVGGRLVFAGIREEVRQIFEIAGFIPLFEIAPSAAAATKSLE